MSLRPQYHLRNSERGLLAWDVKGLIALAENCVPFDLALTEIAELDLPFWFEDAGGLPTCRKIAEHTQLIAACDLIYPIILDPEGKVMDGMHRVCRAWMENRKFISAVRLKILPEPDFVGIPAEELPYV